MRRKLPTDLCWRRVLLPTLLVAIMLSSSGCVYFNTFYLARKNFNQAESSRKKEKRDKASGGEIKGYQEAIKKCSKILSEHPNSSWVDDALFVIGKSFYYLGDYAKAERKFRELLSSFPESQFADESRFFLGKSRYQLENYMLAREMFTEYIAESKKTEWRAEATYLMAEMARSEEKNDEAIKYYQEFAETYRSDFRRQEAMFKMGELQYLQQNYAAAEKSFALAAQLANEPKAKLSARYEQGRALYMLDSVAAGLALFEELRAEQQDSVYLGNILLRIAEGKNLLGDEREAVLYYDDIATNFAKRVESAEAYYHLGEIAQNQMDDLGVAKDMYLLASKEQRGDKWRAQALEKVSDITKFETYRAALASDSSETVVTNRFLLAEMYRTDLERPDSALAEYTTIVDQHPTSDIAPRALLAIGWLYENHYRDTAKAHVYYERVVNEYPKSDAVQQAVKLLQLEGAEPYELYPDKLYAMAETQYFDQHNLDSARILFTKLIEEFPSSRLVPQADFAVAKIDLERFVPQNKPVRRPEPKPKPQDSTAASVDSLQLVGAHPADSGAVPAHLADSSSHKPASQADSAAHPPIDTIGVVTDSMRARGFVNPTDSLIRPSEVLGRNRGQTQNGKPPAADSMAAKPPQTDSATVMDTVKVPTTNPADSLIRPSEVLGRNRAQTHNGKPPAADSMAAKPPQSDSETVADTVKVPATNPADSLIRPSEVLGRNRAQTHNGKPPAADSLKAKLSSADSAVVDKSKPGASVPPATRAAADTTTKSGVAVDSSGNQSQKPAAVAAPADTIVIDSTMIWRFQELAEKYAGTPIGDEAARLAQGEARRTQQQQQKPVQQEQRPTPQDSVSRADSAAVAPLDTLTQAQLDEKRLQDEIERWPLMEYKPTNDIEFKYPLDAATSKFEGRVVLKIKIEFDGKVTDVQFLKGSKIATIDQEVDRVMRLTEFDPLRIDPLKIGGYFIYNYEIRLPEVYR
ncbi:MAG: TonB family protein [candidate division Zixibacteria bacterium]|nr:TonB family protein [candidate division Zixibacteria bacterium]